MARQPVIKAYYELHLDGKRVGRRRLSRSFVVGFVGLLYVQITQASRTVTDTGGTGRSVPANSNQFATNAATGTSLKGIVVGTGTTAVAPGDTKLVTQIATGAGSGQLAYQAELTNAPTSDSTTNSFQWQRLFINNSGSTITVNEIGIYCDADGTPHQFCIVRDVIGGGVAVGAGQTLTVTYTFSAAI